MNSKILGSVVLKYINSRSIWKMIDLKPRGKFYHTNHRNYIKAKQKEG